MRRLSIEFSRNTCMAVQKGWGTPTTGMFFLLQTFWSLVFAFAERCQKWKRILWYHRSIYCSLSGSVCALLLNLIFFCRECGTSQERSCAPRRFQAIIWIHFKLLSVYPYFLYFWHTWCLSVAFCICVSRWLSFLNAPRPTDSPLSCTVGRQRMTWFSSVFTSSPSQS